jgi:hypothetical protein
VTIVSPEELYLRLGQLIAEMPDLTLIQPLTTDNAKWLGRAMALLNAAGDMLGLVEVKNAVGYLNDPSRNRHYVDQIILTLYAALAKAELAVPAGLQGSFIPAKSPYDALLAVGRILETAASDIFLLDAYADEKILEYARIAPVGVTIRVLADDFQYGRSRMALKPAADLWRQQFTDTRPLEVRLAAPKSMHDRAIFIDRGTAWIVQQSFNALATRSPTTLVKVTEPEILVPKLAAYEIMWATATVL